MRYANTKLSATDANAALDLIQQSLDCKNNQDFLILIDKLRNLLIFDHARCACVDRTKFITHKMKAVKFITFFPKEWETRYDEKDYVVKDSVALWAVRHSGLFYWDDARKRFNTDKAMRITNEAATMGLVDGWVYTRKGVRASDCAFISLAGKTMKKNDRHKALLNNTLPHLVEALKRISTANNDLCPQLTPRENQVLRWIAEGKTAWEISVILNISHRTVEFHTRNILSKFDAVNSQQAVAMAMSRNII